MAYFYFVSTLFVFFNLSFNSGVDNSINELVDTLVKQNGVNLLIFLPFNFLQIFNKFIVNPGFFEYKKLFIFFSAAFFFTCLLLFIT